MKKQRFFQKIPLKLVAALLFLAALLFGAIAINRPPVVTLTADERAWLDAHDGTVRLSPCPGWEPMEFFDENEGYYGMAADYIRLIEKKLDFRFKIVKYASWSDILDKAKSGEVDVIAAAHPTPERWEFMNWTEPYLEFPAVIITHKSVTRDLVPEDMDDMKAGVCKNYVVEQYLRKNYPRIVLHPVDFATDGLEKVSFRELDAMVLELPNAFYTIEEQKITNLRMAGKTQWVAKYGIGTNKSMPELHAIMQKALNMITPSEKRSIQRRWIGLEQSILLYKRPLWYAAMAFLTVIIMIIGFVFTWNRTLKRRVDEATRDLHNELEERIRAQERTRKLEDQLRQAHKMEAIGTLAGGIAHDFNNILGTIIGYAEMIEMFDTPSQGKMRERLDHVLSASYRAKDLVNQILTFSRQSEGEKRTVILAPLIKETIKFVQVLLPSSIEVETLMEDEGVAIVANPVQIHQMLMNLCTNAAHAIGEENQGKIQITLTRQQLDPHEAAQYLGMGPGHFARVTVEDTGIGMKPDVVERIFDPFFTTKPTGEGTGMGLSVVHGVVKSCCGHISVHSEPGRGTSFEILIPEADPGNRRPEVAVVPQVFSGDGRILLVDDEGTLAVMGQELLEGLGYDVVCETSSLAALEIFKEDPQAFDLVLTDLIMPDLSGDRLAGKIKAIRPDIPVILCSGRIGNRRAEETLARYGIDAFLRKPVGARQLAETLQQYLSVPAGKSRRGNPNGAVNDHG